MSRQPLNGASPPPEPAAIADPLALLPIAAADPPAVEALLDAAFGPDRRGKTAYRIRAGVDPLPHLSFAGMEAGDLVGSVQTWPVELVGDDGPIVPLVLLGPIAVRPDRQQAGIGRVLTAHAIAAIDRAGESATVLIGDPEYYSRFFGFSPDATAGWRAPGPVEPRRLLARLAPGVALPARGLLRPRSR